jgi:hypothetical protein
MATPNDSFGPFLQLLGLRTMVHLSQEWNVSWNAANNACAINARNEKTDHVVVAAALGSYETHRLILIVLRARPISQPC